MNKLKLEENLILGFYPEINKHIFSKEETRKPLKSYDISFIRKKDLNSLFLEKNKDVILSKNSHDLLLNIRRGLGIFYAMFHTYENSSNLSELKRINLLNQLTETQKVEFAEKLKTNCLISLFSFVSFVLSKYNEYENLPIDYVNKLIIQSKEQTIDTCLEELIQVIETSIDEEELVNKILSYLSILKNKLIELSKNYNYLDFFTSVDYYVEKDDFTISGFNHGGLKTKKIEMSFKKPEEVIGNELAKSQSLKLIKQLMSYDFTIEKNPFVELGGFPFTFLGDGKPGTGKTTLIQMIAGKLNEYCEIAKYPFRYENFTADGIDSYQGKSGQNMKNMINRILDPKVIGFGTIDDIDQIAGKRNDKNSSSGQQEVTAILMESFSGANTIVRGNSTFGMFSNYPENIDDALRQRSGLRMLIDGPQTLEDYTDIFYLLLGKNHNISLGEYKPFITQNLQERIKKTRMDYLIPKEKTIIEAYNKTIKITKGIKTIKDIGIYLKQIQEIDNRFTGRAIKNITDVIKTRVMDFELPEEYFTNPSIFLKQDYNVKLNMIKDLMTPIKIDDIIQEINIYADSEARYSNEEEIRKIKDVVNNLTIDKKAIEEFNRIRDEKIN